MFLSKHLLITSQCSAFTITFYCLYSGSPTNDKETLESSLPETLPVAGGPAPRSYPSPYEDADPTEQPDALLSDPMYDQAAPRTVNRDASPPPNPMYEEATRPPNRLPMYEEPVLKTAQKKPSKKKSSSPSPEPVSPGPISPDSNAPTIPEYAPVVQSTYQDPKTINRSAHPETGELYTEIQPKKKKEKKGKKKKKEDEMTDEQAEEPDDGACQVCVYTCTCSTLH